jgi:RNA recognition motif-containing protein
VESRLLVSNLPYSATPDALRNFFTELGYAVQEVDIGPKKNRRLPPGYALVTLARDVDPHKAIQDTDGREFQGRTLLVDGWKPFNWRHRSERAA